MSPRVPMSLNDGQPVLAVRDVSVRIELRHSTVRAVDGVSLEIQPGQTLGIVGESGSGKTMTALSIMRLLPAGGSLTSGQVILDGASLHELSEREMRTVRGEQVGMIFQDPMSSLNPTMPIGLQVAEPLKLHRNMPGSQLQARITEMLRLVRLPDPQRQATAFPHQLSGGMRQRVMIAMALACEPKLLIADEPTTGLDVTVQSQILDLIDELKARLGMAVMLVTHDLGVIAEHTQRVAVMYGGRIVEEADTPDLFASPRHPYTRALLSATPQRAVAGHRLASIPGGPPDLSQIITGCAFAPRCARVLPECTSARPGLLSIGGGRMLACFDPVPGSEDQGPAGTESEGQVRPARLAAGAVGHAPGSHGRSRDAADGAGDAGPPGRDLLELECVSKEYPLAGRARLRSGGPRVSAVHEVSFALRQGETLGLVGESGCGKSTIGRLVVGLEHATSGSVRFEGRALTGFGGQRARRLKGQVHLVFQDSAASLDPRRRVQSIVEEPLLIHRAGDRREREQRIRQLLDEVGLPATAAERYPHEFSGGQRQRIALARSLALYPRLIVADEPVSALDVSVQAQILNLMVDLQQRFGLTYLFVSHDLSVVRYLASTIAVMYLGKLVEIGPNAEVYGNAAHPYTQGLIDAIPVPDPAAKRERISAISGEPPTASRPPAGCRFHTRCPRAQDVCTRQTPPLRRFGPESHLAACHFPLQAPAEVTPASATTE
jgi:peptide/nickel transport system ATP-binding protein